MLSATNAAAVLSYVADTGYRFTAVTPLTHQRVNTSRGLRHGETLRDVFGWNIPFSAQALSPELYSRMARAGMLEEVGSLWRSTLRIASVDGDLFLHSAYPTVGADAVFFGPDTYRFARFMKQSLARRLSSVRAGKLMRVLDIGCGSGAGGVVVARALAAAGIKSAVTMNDINPAALTLTAANAEIAGVAVTLAAGDALSAVEGDFVLIVCNPPYLDDEGQRSYRHGGAHLGRALGVRIAAEALQRLAPGGQLLFYTGVAMVDGDDPFLAEMAPLLSATRCDWSYEEIDPDVFGEEIERPIYARIDRIAAVGLVATHPLVPAD